MGHQEVAVRDDEDRQAHSTRLRWRLTSKQRKVLRLMARTQCSIWQACDSLGYSRRTAHTWTRDPKFIEARDAMIAEAIENAGVDAAYVLINTREVVERSMQKVAVLDDDGKPTGEWEFDARSALGGLKMLGEAAKVWDNPAKKQVRDGPGLTVIVQQAAIAGPGGPALQGRVEIKLAGPE